ncbi:hypothetical protein GDO86_007581 [Hymenochirus boettgeri]|uniref:Hemicentin-1 n=1 Tax=Hymenochirus boettgeri TaxID=247094 RepID=A0A8T2J2C8_9PIPI|nr:hypothetical protein GDO86_007581 [Hymenochirus boettgeri]
MYDDLVQVIEGASKILETSLNRQKKPLYNFALVPFHDPEIGPVTITTDPEKFQNELKELYVQGGGDCPEMSVGAIKIALEISLPGSFIYVFTDARSKDYHLTNDVLQLIQQKQSQVVFVLTGDCDDRSHAGYKVYEEIASTSSGQVFHLDKKQVNEVLKWVEEAVQASKVHLISTDHSNGAAYTWEIPFDPSLKEVTVSLSGPSPTIELYDPSGKRMKPETGVIELLNIFNSAKVLNIKEPVPGMWKIKTSSIGRHSVRITGVSTIDFRAGFSSVPTLDFSETSSRPVQGIPTHLLLNTKGIKYPSRTEHLELLTPSGNLLKTIPIKHYPDRVPYEIWNVTEFIPPNEAFFLKLIGYDKDDYLFQRVSSVSFSNRIPGPPKVSMLKLTAGYYLQPGQILCFVESLIPVTVHFSRNGVKLGTDLKFRESVNATWEIANVSVTDEGHYECHAVSSTGSARAQTFFDVNEPPPVLKVPSNITINTGERAVLTCNVISTVRYNLTWLRNNTNVKNLNSSNVSIMRNNSLEINSVTLNNAGEYICFVTNEGGTTTASISLVVQDPPKVVLVPKTITYTKGTDIKLKCSAAGYPKANIIWMHSDMFVRFSSRYILTQDGTFIIKNSVEKDAGVYTCLATNIAGTDYQTSILIYSEVPQVTAVRKKMLVSVGSETTMECKATGVPRPLVQWFKDEIELSTLPLYNVDVVLGILKIKNTQFSDAGNYVCVAVNNVGQANGKFTLSVGSPPAFTKTPSDVSMDIGSELSLTCSAQGFPEPEIKWRRLNHSSESLKPLSYHYNSQQKMGTLHISKLWIGDEGIYICEAENQFGKINSQATITVTGLVVPVIGESPSVVSVIEENQLTLPCILLAGNPLPKRHWVKNNIVLVSDPYIAIRTDGSLHFERVLLKDGGDYLCTAKNVAGTADQITRVNVYVSPVIQHGPQIFSTIEGTPVSLPCKALGVPKPSIIWKKKEEIIALNNATITAESDGSLHLSSPGGEDSGEYSCNAVNAAGFAARKVQLTVYVKPRIVSPELNGTSIHHKNHIEVSVRAGDDVILPCEVKSVPPPFITWAKETQLISPFSQRHSVLPSGSMKIFETRISDAGTYRCVGTNIAGNVTQTVKLNVYVLPKIQRGPRIIRVKINHHFEISCISHGIPPPSTSWYKDGKKIKLDQGLQNNILHIKSANISDGGTYACISDNLIGQDYADTIVEIHVPPSLYGVESPYDNQNQERVSRQQISFPCPVKGNPKPIIKWYRNGRELTGSEPGISIAQDRTILIIDSLTPYDNGEYTCMASNEVGQTEKKYSLKVHDPPVVKDKDKMTNISVLLHQITTLLCEASGSPPVIITWYKHRAQVVETAGVQILEKGRILKILNSSVNDSGQYVCKASNIAGSSEKKYFVHVLDPPVISGAGTIIATSVVAGKEVNLECKVTGIPLPSIQWFKENRLLSTEDPNVHATENGQILHIKKSRLSDNGLYKCIATNAAGSQIKESKLSVYIAPTIKDGNNSTEQSFLVNGEINLECDARGIPSPTITWYKDGQKLLSGPHVTFIEKGKYLRITNSKITDGGMYVCSAVNVAGVTEKSYLVDVYVPARIDGDKKKSQNKKVIAGKSLTLECEAFGHPFPLITWLKDGVPVEINDNVRILYNGKKLEIRTIMESDHGLFTCVAVNIAGETEIKYKVSVLVPPFIEDGSDPEDHTVIASSPVELECFFNGTPLPTIVWLKNGIPVEISGRLRLQTNGQKLLIPSAESSDSGSYQCVVKNEAGSSTKQFNIAVHVRPTIKPEPSLVSVLMDKSITMQCIASGVPNPHITWLKDELPLNIANGNINMESFGHSLQFKKTFLEDAGKYTCVATNAAGEAKQIIWLNVLEPPSIENSGEMTQETVTANNLLILECKATGNPDPVITWFKDNQQLPSTGEISLLDRGQRLQISRAQIIHSGIYKCLASSIAGTAELTYRLQVHVPPYISGRSDQVTVIVNNLTRLECEAIGFPTPSLTWLKDGSPISSFTDGIQILSGGRVLALTNAQIGDAGKYTCVAVNAAGEHQKDFDLSVYVPPNIMGEEQNISTLITETIILTCQSNAVPPPVLTWYKDWKPLIRRTGLSISEDGSILKIENAQIRDTGRYSCEAVNIAGKMEKNFNVNIMVPPAISGSVDMTELTVIEGTAINLQCDSSGNPLPSLSWKKNESNINTEHGGHTRLLSGGQQLQILTARKSDSGNYTCTASNVVGNVTRKYIVHVYVRPTFTETGHFHSEVEVIQGNNVTFECDARGDPPPMLTWLREGIPLINGNGYKLTNHGKFLHLEKAQVSNAGIYVCVAVNLAGQSDRKYDLKILVPPRFSGGLQKHENISIAEKNPLTLTCEVSGTPPPKVTWYKDGQPVSLRDSPQNISGGFLLRFSTSTVSDAGRYTCVVSNAAGEEMRHFDVNVLVPPRIVGSSLEGIKVKERENVTLSCEATGIPVPQITWLKDGLPILEYTNHHVDYKTQSLLIVNAMLRDSGRYQCIASNSAGHRSKSFSLGVLVPPTINGTTEGSPEDVSVILYNSVSLECEVHSHPPATITWYKEGQQIRSKGYVRVLPGGRTLQILKAREDDAGRYSCIATNEAGDGTYHYNLKVYTPPKIKKDDILGIGTFSKEIKAIVNTSFTLICEVTAFPLAKTTWYKDGQPVDADNHQAVIDENKLYIEKAQLSDTGRYTCLASNIAGEDELDFDITIQVPPNFPKLSGLWVTSESSNGESSGEHKEVIINNPISLYCETNAVPPPTITWYKDGKLLTPNNRVFILPGGHILQIARAHEDDGGSYTCVAVNEAGKDSLHYNVHVLLPPTLEGSHEKLSKDITSLVNETLILNCPVLIRGNPMPTISWLKESHHIQEGMRYQIYENGRSFKILSTQLMDTGRYVCVVENPAGSVQKSFNLNVFVPPSVMGSDTENVTVVETNFISLTCGVTGFPPPAIIWFKNGNVLSSNSHLFIAPGGRTLQIAQTKLSDSGEYSCTAANQAGEAKKTIFLNIYAPPRIVANIKDSNIEMNVKLNTSAKLECNFSAVPVPIIHWYKNGQIVRESENHKFLDEGQSLLVKNAQVSDTGEYECVVTNVVGQDNKKFFLNIHVFPTIQGLPDEYHDGIAQNSVTFSCDAYGIPIPALKWLKNGHEISLTDSLEIQILFGGSKMKIARAQLSDGGNYTCLASNVEGTSEKNYILTIQVPPSIDGSGTTNEFNVLPGETVQLKCNADGIPPPTIHWLKDGKHINEDMGRISAHLDGEILTILKIQTSDMGKYTCVATNSAGEDDKIYSVNVYVAPRIDEKKGVAVVLTAVLDTSINIECHATGFPTPQIKWLKNGFPLPISSQVKLHSGGQVLRISRAQKTDAGVYTCVASNRAGIDNKNYDLQVYISPSVDEADITQELTVIKGDPVSMQCIANGLPAPTMSWLKDGKPLDNKYLSYLKNNRMVIQILNAEMDDIARYSCVASNPAGSVSKHFILNVMESPHINGSDITEELSTVINTQIELVCYTTGSPPPLITWLKDGQPLSQTENIHLLKGGQILRITSAREENFGRYTCLASNPAGDAKKEFWVTIHMPPNIAGVTGTENITVLLKKQIIMECKSDAYPLPQITWLKDGKPLLSNSSGGFLQIENAEVEDTGRYTCVASNIAGKKTKDFILSVQVPPSIQEGPSVVKTFVNDSINLECIATGVPLPRIAWRKDGSILSNHNTRLVISGTGSLYISSTKVADSGEYFCLATNAAGSSQRQIDLLVYESPSINSVPTHFSAMVNVQTLLPCEVTGTPKPKVEWKKNGHVINTNLNQNIYRLLSSGSLVIISPSVDDNGIYVCTALNDAGQDEIEMYLSVQVPPSIADEVTSIFVTKLSPVLIPCTVSGVPFPSIQWIKDGTSLFANSNNYRILPSGSLEIASSQFAHSGNYTCKAVNGAGSAQIYVTLHVQEVPLIKDESDYLEVILQNPIILPCKASGTPSPTITWQKEGAGIKSGSSYVLLPSGDLKITNATHEDAGTYTCIAQNPAGTALKKTRLKVYVPPVIITHQEEYVVPVDMSVMLFCEAHGSPTPEITWHKDGVLLTKSVGPRMLASGGLHMAVVQPDDAGLYTCTAENIAGSISSKMNLSVLIPPQIVKRVKDVSVIITNQTVLPCTAHGYPKPTLTWTKNNVPITDKRGTHSVLPSGDLILYSVQHKDVGTYTCTASNIAGEDTHSVRLTVHFPPSFTELPTVVSLNEGDRLRLLCKATGNPLPQTSWIFKDNIFPGLQERRSKQQNELVIQKVLKENAGSYMCVAENIVASINTTIHVIVKEPPALFGFHDKDQSVPLGGNIVLNCVVKGNPLPKIQWYKRAKLISFNNQMKQFTNGSLAVYNVGREDAGDYTCIATNDAGVLEHTVRLMLQRSPTIKVLPLDTIVSAGETVILNCQAEGEPVPRISWYRHTYPITGGNRFTVLSNNSLQIVASQKEDTSVYECKATNIMGTVSVKVTFTVQVHGEFSEWLPWQSCSVTCGQGVQQRIRRCDNPLPANGGLYCQGEDTERQSCKNKPCPVDGNWSDWSSWEECSRTCGSGKRTRVRTCSDPATQEGGKTCAGKTVDFAVCNEKPCPVDGIWGAWQYWGECSKTCGKGTQTRIRHCNNPAPSADGLPCNGQDTQMQICSERQCPVDGKWSVWGSWTTCSFSCGGGLRQRTRMCSSPAPQHGGHKCEGSSLENEICNEDLCPIHGNWGTWSPWGSCSRKCNGGQIRRYRSCDNPAPSHNGRACVGSDTETNKCNTDACPADGNWGPWETWSKCSVSCGGGELIRTRLCVRPLQSDFSRTCPGDSTQLLRCNVQACPGGPQRVRGNLFGNINDLEFGIANLNASITDDPTLTTKILQAKFTNIPKSLGPSMRNLVSVLNPLYWTIAKEIGEAVNGFALTGGLFKRESQVEFATGEILHITHTVRGVDSDGSLLLDTVVKGHVLQLQSSVDLRVKDYTEDYVQTGPGEIHAYSTRMFSVDGVYVPYTWNHTISYDPDQGTMPFLVQTLHVSSVKADYDQLEESLQFLVHASISRGDSNTQCPPGFSVDASGLYCNDDDECASHSLCSHSCHNIIGSYYCSCPKGLIISDDGKTCHDIDECELEATICRKNQECKNTVGSYICAVKCESGFRAINDFACQDINECLESNPCHHRCFNSIGGFHCGCDPGYQLKSRRCIDLNECRHGVCRPDQLCKNTRGSYKCIDVCAVGFTRAENGSCVDINECQDSAHQCKNNQICENTHGSYFCVCPRGYKSEGAGTPCVDINECERGDVCQHECKNILGSYQCLCPSGYHLMPNGKTCQDIDECVEQNIQCGINRMCFNMRGSHQCIDTPCPPNYLRDYISGFCLKNCAPNDLECALSPYALQYKLVSLPFGIVANQDLIRLVAYTEDGILHPRTTFIIDDDSGSLPFSIREEDMKGVVFTNRPLQKPETYKMKVKALSYSIDRAIEYQTAFIVYIAVSPYPY